MAVELLLREYGAEINRIDSNLKGVLHVRGDVDGVGFIGGDGRQAGEDHQHGAEEYDYFLHVLFISFIDFSLTIFFYCMLYLFHTK